MKSAEKERLIKSDILSIESQVRHTFNQGYDLGYKEGIKKNKKQPKTGHWIISPNDCFATCSECGLSGDKGIFKHYRWCPICGTKMSEIPTGSEKERKEEK